MTLQLSDDGLQMCLDFSKKGPAPRGKCTPFPGTPAALPTKRGPAPRGKCVQFPGTPSVYADLIKLFDLSKTPQECSSCLEAAKVCHENGGITEAELAELVRIGRQKRLDLARPEPKKTAATAPGVYTYTPEMGESEPEAIQMTASLSYYGKHYHIDTPLELKGRGITKNDPPHWCEGTRKARENWQSYTVTKRAFEKLKTQYVIGMECRLD